MKIWGKPIMSRSAHAWVVIANPAIPTQIVTNASLDLSIGNSVMVDYSYYKVNPNAGEATGTTDPKNQIRFNISPPINDYFNISTPLYKIWADVGAMTNDMQDGLYCLVQMNSKRNGGQYINTGLGFPDFSIGGDTYQCAFKGYVNWTSDDQLANAGNPYYGSFENVSILLDNNYTTNYDASVTAFHSGNIYLYNYIAVDVRYTNLRTGATQTATLLAQKLQQVPCVYSPYKNDGNSVEFLVGGSVVWSGTFTPKTECKYDVVVCDYIGKYGVWKRVYFYKASYNNLEVKTQDFISSSLTIDNYGVFDVNGNSTIKVNTDWVDEYFNNDLKELMLSERILLDNKVVKLRTKSTELHKNINNKLINYTLEFEYCNDLIRGEL